MIWQIEADYVFILMDLQKTIIMLLHKYHYIIMYFLLSKIILAMIARNLKLSADTIMRKIFTKNYFLRISGQKQFYLL